MKKISTAAALLAAGALLFGSLIVACSPHGTGIIDDPTPKPTPASEEEDNGKPVDGSWDFTGTDTYSIGHSAYASLTDKALTNPTAKGATLSLSGSVKWGNGSATDTSNFCLWFDKGSEYEAGKEDSKSKGHFTLTIDNMSTLTIVATGNGSSDTAKRWIAVCNKDKKVLTNGTLTALSSGDAADKKLNIKLPKAGTYYIYTSGTRIRSLQITNQAFESKTADVTNDVATLGLVATNVRNSDDTIATGEVKDGKIVITSKKEGTAKVYAGTSLTEYATINVTVSSTGAITTNIIKYVAFTAATNDATANNIETLGLVGTKVDSSAEEYVKADLTTTTGKITIKSVKAPGDSAKSITITVTDANTKTATIAVTEARDGSLTLGTITKYERPAPVKDTDYTVAALVLTATNPIEYSTDAGSTWTALAASASYTATQNGSVKVRFAANASYAASKDASVQLTDGNGGSVEYVLDLATEGITFENVVKDGAESPTNPTTGDITINGLKFDISGNKGKDLPDTQNSLKVISLGGQVSKTKNFVKFTTTKAASVTVMFFNGTADRHAKIISENDSTGQTGTEATTADKEVKTTTFTLSDAGTYYLGGDNGIYITKITITL